MSITISIFKGKKLSLEDIVLYNSYEREVNKRTEFNFDDDYNFIKERFKAVKEIDEEFEFNGKLYDIFTDVKDSLERITLFDGHFELFDYLEDRYNLLQAGGIKKYGNIYILYKEDIEELLEHSTECISKYHDDFYKEYVSAYDEMRKIDWSRTKHMCEDILKDYEKDDNFAIYQIFGI